jgi:protoporphyrinogen oxidase
MMWERARDRVVELGGLVHMTAPVVRVEHGGGRLRSVVSAEPGGERRTPVDHVIASMPLGQLVRALAPAPPDDVLRAADDLRHRDFLTVALVVPQDLAFPDNWIYVHDPAVRVGRIQNFGAWSPFLVKDGRTCLGLEYFVNEGDDVWSSSDEALVALATRELDRLGLVPRGAVHDGYVVRMPKAYPVYDDRYQANVATIRRWLAAHLPDLHPVGRNGMHRYNNADHSMLTALLAARNVMGASPAHDVWTVNVEDEYHEETRANHARGTGRDAPVLPRRLSPARPSVQAGARAG